MRAEIKKKLIAKFGNVETLENGSFMVLFKQLGSTSKYFASPDSHIIWELDLGIVVHDMVLQKGGNPKLAIWFTPFDIVEDKIVFPDYSKLHELGPMSDFDKLIGIERRCGFEGLGLLFVADKALAL